MSTHFDTEGSTLMHRPQLRLAPASALVAALALTAAPQLAPAQEHPRSFDGPVVFVKDRSGYVGVVFKLNRTLPRASNGRVRALATLRTDINDRGVQPVGGRCYESILGFAPKWGTIGNRYQLKLEVGDTTVKRSGVLYRATTGYRIAESTGLRKDPKVTRRLDC